jgi:hypothetical protein
VESLIRSPLTDPPFALEKKFGNEKKEKRRVRRLRSWLRRIVRARRAKKLTLNYLT